MRFLAGLILVLSILYLPAWVSILITISFAFVFNAYYEALIFGFMADRLYAPEAILTNAYALKYFLIFTFVVALAEFLKPHFRYYHG